MRAWLKGDFYRGKTEEEKTQADIIHYEMVQELADSRDTEVLPELLRFYTDENTINLGDFDACLEDAIWGNYSAGQILNALCEIFDVLCGDDTSVYLCERFCEEGLFEAFRKMFNVVKAKRSEEFIKCMEIYNKQRLMSNSFRGIDLEPIAATLREDMKHWPERQGQAQVPTLKG